MPEVGPVEVAQPVHDITSPTSLVSVPQSSQLAVSNVRFMTHLCRTLSHSASASLVTRSLPQCAHLKVTHSRVRTICRGALPIGIMRVIYLLPNNSPACNPRRPPGSSVPARPRGT